jgi:hypothetical protein
MRLKPFDIVIAVAAAGLVVLAAVAAYGPGIGQSSAVLTGRGGEWIYPLSVDREIDVAGPLGTTIVEIRNKAVRIKDSPCPNQTCIAAGSIASPGQWVACLPNRVMVRIEGRRADAGVDAAAY